MLADDNSLTNKVALITGSARRVGAITAKILHQAGMNIIIHYHNSKKDAEELQAKLQKHRANSVFLVQGDLLDIANIEIMMEETMQKIGRLDVLVNNASTFYPSKIETMSETDWENLIGVNLKAPLFLTKALNPYLQKTNGCVVNMADIHADRPLKDHTIYSIAKAGVVMMTKSLARELAPKVRVNAIAPGAILWPETGKYSMDSIINATALKRVGSPNDIAKAILYLIKDADYITGQVLNIDGGRTLSN